MKIVSVHEGIVPISSSIRNAWIDFSSMDCSIVAVVSDVIVDGKPLVGYGFNSNGRYSAGDILRRRIIPRLLAAPAEEILNEDGTNFDPTKAWDFLMRNEKPGGHGERSVAVGVIDMALFDLAAKVAGQPLYRFLSDKYGDGSPTTRCSSTPPAATTPRTRACRSCRTRCADSWTWATGWSR